LCPNPRDIANPRGDDFPDTARTDQLVELNVGIGPVKVRCFLFCRIISWLAAKGINDSSPQPEAMTMPSVMWWRWLLKRLKLIHSDFLYLFEGILQLHRAI
jgi:hypothetical protein